MSSEKPRIEHTVIYRRDGYYCSFPQLDHLPDGRLAVVVPVSSFRDHTVVWSSEACDEWVVLVSTDQGTTWQETDDPAVPYNWPTGLPRARKSGCSAAVMPDGSYVITGAESWQLWSSGRREEAEGQGRAVRAHPVDAGAILVGGQEMFSQRSTDGGRTWERREWVFPGFGCLNVFPQGAYLKDGTILFPMYGTYPGGDSQSYVWRSADYGGTWRLIPMGGSAPPGGAPNETAFVEVSRGRILALFRTQSNDYLSQSWSDDSGRTWSHPFRTGIWGVPANLLKLRDGRVLCTYGYRRDPMGVRAVASNDGGETWDLDNIYVLRDDGGTRDLGYPASTQLLDGSILTVYYMSGPDGVTYAAATRWEA